MIATMNTIFTAPTSLQIDVSEKEVEERWNQSCIESLNDYLETGLHVTEKEVIQWMDSWGTVNELPPPQCHS